jgi:hypothetical protein
MTERETELNKKININDFYFYSSSETPDQKTCDSITPYDDYVWNKKCFKNDSSDYFLSCYQKELCKNRDYANKILKRKSQYSGSDERLDNTNEIFQTEFMKSINLGIGSLLLLIVLWKSS